MSEYIHHKSDPPMTLPSPKTALELERYIYAECTKAVNELVERLRIGAVLPMLSGEIQKEPLICVLHSQILWNTPAAWHVEGKNVLPPVTAKKGKKKATKKKRK